MALTSNNGSDSAGTPSSDAGTANSGLPVEARPSGALLGAASVMQASQLAASAAWTARSRARSLQIGAMLGKRQILVFLRPLHDVAAQFGGVAIAHGAEEPARLPAVAAMRQFRRR